ncbi:HPr kinase [Nocardia ninae]|uniref:HPr kinase n=1 Tax=Nocardia ninae NBRC 108245 TaxID=1210091 RepID=A0A511MTA9_9NOCA|nr:hypothetical protein [Nocardia ninae]GEM43823.1 hypothetical protein NN4_83420 [Nocardia ninae NBRC 108245]
MTTWVRTCHLGPVSVGLITNSQVVLDLLGEFYQITDADRLPSSWTVEAIVGPLTPQLAINPWGVGYAASPQARRIRLQANGPHHLAVTARKTIREALIDHCEQRHYIMLHASAVVDDHRVIVIVGDKGSGKTTLGLKSVLSHEMRYLSNDHLIVYSDPNDPSSPLTLTSLPTLIPLKIGTYLDLEQNLPPPWDTDGLDIDAHRNVSREKLYGSDRRVLYTFPGLGQQNPIEVDLPDNGPGPSVVVVLASYTNGSPMRAMIDDPVGALIPHVRTDWMFDRNLNQHYLPRHERDIHEYLADAQRLVRRLADRATVLEWRHSGDPSELLEPTVLKGSRS